MTRFRYRAVVPVTGEVRSAIVEAPSSGHLLAWLRRDGLMPIAVEETAAATPAAPVPKRISSACRKGLPHALGELAVLLGAGLPLDRALQIVVEHVPHPALKASFAALRERVKAGIPLSGAMAEAGGLFPPMACALAEAGEASGRLEASLGRAAEALDRAEDLRQTVTSALVYPAMLLAVATGVILVMLLVVVPQFETLLSDLGGTLPFATEMLMRLSRAVRDDGAVGLAGMAGGGLLAVRALRRPEVRARWDRVVLRLPILGPLVASAETARLARTLGSLVESGVPLPTGLVIAGRALGNTHMAAALARVAAGVKEGGGVSAPLAATGIFPPIALSFLRTGEETARLGLMLTRLADVLDRDVRTATQRMIAVMTPLITVILGLAVAGIIAAIFSAILGINDLAIQS
ncbi:type II secretion system F family protein [Magnetospirillum fulvum]|uniref:General secretion pathway protein F n=1 Tax=Magnetospirillum fulvum TaxID=1082 RepID=A0A1H6IJQ7_MAGFU|nr:type II secretion system F family protein [Magnetospirillum fulvum]SEH48133.1 general secretion pathway protein F [Magnetospirillum fulvum]